MHTQDKLTDYTESKSSALQHDEKQHVIIVWLFFFLTPGLMDCPCLPPPAQRKARAGQLNKTRVTQPACYSDHR